MAKNKRDEHLIKDARTLPIFIHSTIDDMTHLTPNDMRVYMHLSRRADKSGAAWPSYQSIGDHCFGSVYKNPEVRKRHAVECIKNLIKSKLLKKEPRVSEHGQQTNQYVLVDPVTLQSQPGGTVQSLPTGTTESQPGGTVESQPESSPQSQRAGIVESSTPGTVQSPKDTPIEDTPLEGTPKEDEESVSPEIRAAWVAHYGEEMPKSLAAKVVELATQQGDAAVIHGIAASVEARARNFSYIAKCARNYIPPARQHNGSNGRYQVDLELRPVPTRPLPVAVVTQPDHGDPWQVCLPELLRALPPHFAARLAGSRLERAGEVKDGAGKAVPLYHVVLTEAEAIRAAATLNLQLGHAIRRSVKSVIGDVQVLLVAAADECHASLRGVNAEAPTV